MAGQKKILLLLGGILLFCGMMVLKSNHSAAAAQVQISGDSNSIFNRESNFSSTKPVESVNTGQLFFKMVLSLLLVIALGVGAIYVSKRLLPKISNYTGKEIKILETTPLGTRKMVHLLKIGDRKFLIGSTSENITMLAEVSEFEAETQRGEEIR